MSAPESEPIGPAATPAPETPPDRELDAPRALLEEALVEIKRVIAGQDEMLERVLVCLVAGGHLLIEGVPGLAKTLTIKTTAAVLGGSFRRIQFTPDLVPSDLVGTRIYRPDQGSFETELGPVFCNFLLADEINRAPAKVQSALLEVMQEHQVTIGHDTHVVPGAVPRDGDAEPDRVRGHVPASRGAGRPLHAQGARRLPRARRGADRRPPLARGPRRGASRSSRSPSSPSSQRDASRTSTSTPASSATRSASPTATREPASFGLERDRGARRLRREPARPDRARPERARARARPRPRLRDPRRPPRARQGRVPAPARPHLPGARGGALGRRRARRGDRGGAAAAARARETGGRVIRARSEALGARADARTAPARGRSRGLLQGARADHRASRRRAARRRPPLGAARSRDRAGAGAAVRPG